MTPESRILLAAIVGGSAAMFGYQAGWRARGDVMRIRGGVIGRPTLIFTEGPIQRGNGHGGLTTPKPDIIPKPQFPPPRAIREDFLP